MDSVGSFYIGLQPIMGYNGLGLWIGWTMPISDWYQPRSNNLLAQSGTTGNISCRIASWYWLAVAWQTLWYRLDWVSGTRGSCKIATDQRCRRKLGGCCCESDNDLNYFEVDVRCEYIDSVLHASSCTL